MSFEISTKSILMLFEDLTIQPQQISDTPASSSNIENHCVSGENSEKDIKLPDKGQPTISDPQKLSFKLKNTDYLFTIEAKSKLDVSEKEFRALKKKNVDTSMTNLTNTRKFNEQPIPQNNYLNVDEVYSVTKASVDQYVDTIQKQAMVLEEHVRIIYTATLFRSTEFPKIINYFEHIQSLKVKIEHCKEHTKEKVTQELFQLQAVHVNVHQEAKNVYIKYIAILYNLEKIAKLHKLLSFTLAKCCRRDAKILEEISQTLSDMADIYEAHAEVFDKLESVFQKYKDLCIARAESI